MSDHFGIGAAMQSMVRIYQQASRQSGRTTSLLESVKDGDRVVFLAGKEASRFDRMCQERGVKVSVCVAPVGDPHVLFNRGTSEGRTLFEHTWVEAFYALAIERASNEIDTFQRELSGYGEAHRETKRAALELARWGR